MICSPLANRLSFLCALLLCAGALISSPQRIFAQGAEGAPVEERGGVEPIYPSPDVTRPDRAVLASLEDARALATVDPLALETTRYVYCFEPLERIVYEGEEKRNLNGAAVSYTANTALLRDADPYRAVAIGPEGTHGGNVYRLTLGDYVGYDETKLRLLLDTWDRMTDTTLYLPTDTIVSRLCAPYSLKAGDSLLSESGQRYSPRASDVGKRFTKVRVRKVTPAVHADVSLREGSNGALTELILLTGSTVPIISKGQFLRFALNSDNGGLYPDFQAIDKSPTKGTAEEAFLARSGVNLKDLGDRNADQRVILMRTPTANAGFIEYVPSAVTRPSVGPNIATITRDFFKGRIDNRDHPYENLVDRKHDGSEIFAPTEAGGLRFALFDADGGFVASAPPNLACDRSIPAPFLTILDGPSGCVRCHLQRNEDTKTFSIYRKAPNYLQWMLNVEIDGERFDVFAEFSPALTSPQRRAARRASNQSLLAIEDPRAREAARKELEGLRKLARLFNGDTADAFAYAGRTYAKFVFNATGVPLEIAAEAMLTSHDEWLYSWVEPKDALLTLGYRCETNTEAVNTFNVVCPPAPEPLRVTQLRAWSDATPIRISIDDWLEVYPEVALRVSVHESSLPALAPVNPPQPPEE